MHTLIHTYFILVGKYLEAAKQYDHLVKIPQESTHNYKREVFYYTVYRSKGNELIHWKFINYCKDNLNLYYADAELEAEVLLLIFN